MGEECRDREARDLSRQQAQLRDDDADHRSGHLHGEQAARPQERGDHTDIRKDNRPEED